jgi:hypothetical protein
VGTPDSIGATVSPTVTLKVAPLELPAASRAEQVTVVVLIGKVEPGADAHVTGTLPSTTSVATGSKYVTGAPSADSASVVIAAGTPEITGAVVSRTVTVNDAAVEFSAASAAVQCTVDVPSAKVDPDAGKQRAATLPSALSLAVTA